MSNSDGSPRVTGHTDQAERNRKIAERQKARIQEFSAALKAAGPRLTANVARVASAEEAMRGVMRTAEEHLATLRVTRPEDVE